MQCWIGNKYPPLHTTTLTPHSYLQVPVDKILGQSRSGFAMLRSLIEQEKQFVLARVRAVPAPAAPPATSVSAAVGSSPAPVVDAHGAVATPCEGAPLVPASGECTPRLLPPVDLSTCER